MRTRGRAGLLVAAAAVGAAVAAAMVVPGPPPRPTAPVPEQVPVTSTVLGCATGPDEADVSSATTDVPGSAGPAPVRTVRARGDVARVAGRGQGAVGLLAWRAGTQETTACPAPRSSWWFAGAGGGLDHRTTLVLSDVDEGATVVDVELVGATGRVDDQALRDLTVPPGSRRVIALAAVAPSSDELTVHVTTNQGRVVAQAYDSWRSRVGGRTGHEWLPPSAPPSTDVRMPGVPADADRRTLLVTNTSDRQALVTPQVVTDDGAFVPRGHDEISVDPGAVAAVPLGAGFDRRYAGIRLRSDVPVVGALRSQVGDDTAYAAGGETAMGFLAAPTPGRSTLLLQGTDEPSGADVSAWSAQGRRVGSAGVSVPPSGLATWSVPDDAAYVLVRPDTGRGALVVAVVSRLPRGVAALPLGTVPVTVARPPVRLRTE
jgi:hypothetical protein